MERIFEFLPFQQRLTASRTCKTWYQLAFSPKFCRKTFINLTNRRDTFKDIHAYENYRNASVEVYDWNQGAIADFFSAAPLEWLRICGTTAEINTLLDDRLLSMNQLTTLAVGVSHREAVAGAVVRISHPALKSLKCEEYFGIVTFEINCPCLSDLHLSCMTSDDCEKAVQLVIQLQQQLQSLHVDILETKLLKKLATAKLNHLKKLGLYVHRSCNGIDLLLNKITHLVELRLSSTSNEGLHIGEELGVMKNLSKLSLDDVDIDTAGFELALRKMEKLKDLDINECRFRPPTQSWHIASALCRNLSVSSFNSFSVMLPHCPQLKSLKWFVGDAKIDDIFERACNFYPLLENLHLGAIVHGEFSSSTSFSHIKQLKFLKELHFSKINLKNVDWTECRSMKLEKLQLNYCETEPEELLVFESVGRHLRQLFLNRCNQSYFSTPIMKPFVELLRKKLPWCKVSCEYNHKNEETWGDEEFIDPFDAIQQFAHNND